MLDSFFFLQGEPGAIGLSGQRGEKVMITDKSTLYLFRGRVTIWIQPVTTKAIRVFFSFRETQGRREMTGKR